MNRTRDQTLADFVLLDHIFSPCNYPFSLQGFQIELLVAAIASRSANTCRNSVSP